MSDDHAFSGLNTLLFCTVLGLSMLCGYFLKKKGISYIPPSLASIMVGVVIGFLVMMISKEELQFLKFNPELFFFILLPPIIFEAGYQLQRKRFLRNFSSILLYAIVGTLISTFSIGMLTYWAALNGMIMVDNKSPLESLMFGALISSVDPVATLSILGNPDLNVDPTLYSLIFGESVLNDAVCIVLFRTFQVYAELNQTTLTILNFSDMMMIILNFLLVSLGSILIGTITALGCCFLFKHTQLRQYPGYEIIVLLIFPYVSFALGEVLGLSGIMALFLSGVILSHYNIYNISDNTRIASTQLFEALSLASETITFAYMGIVLFTGEFTQWDPAFIFLALAFCLVGRALNVFPLSAVANLKRKNKITPKMQFVMWFAGLRGAIPFALAFNMPQSGPMWNREVIVTTTLSVCLITTFILGSLTEPLLKRMNLSSTSAAVDDDDGGDHYSFLPSSINNQNQNVGGLHMTFRNIDEKVMKIFSNKDTAHLEEPKWGPSYRGEINLDEEDSQSIKLLPIPPPGSSIASIEA